MHIGLRFQRFNYIFTAAGLVSGDGGLDLIVIMASEAERKHAAHSWFQV